MDHTRSKVREVVGVAGAAGLRSIWVDRERRHRLLSDLQRASVFVDVLAEVLGQTDADGFDLLAHLGFAAALRTRRERAEAFANRQSRFLGQHAPPAREVLVSLLDKSRAHGIDEISDARVFRLPPFLEMGQAPGVVRRFGSADRLRKSMQELQQRIYE